MAAVSATVYGSSYACQNKTHLPEQSCFVSSELRLHQQTLHDTVAHFSTQDMQHTKLIEHVIMPEFQKSHDRNGFDRQRQL